MNDHSLHIRPSAEDDLPAITRIYADAVLHGTASFELTAPDQAEMARRRSALVQDGFPYLVAEEAGEQAGEMSGEILGYAYAGPYRMRPAYRSTVEDSIYLHPQAKGRGIGKALLRALIEACEGRDFRLMVAVIGDSESLGSIHLHRAVGFTPVGAFKGIGYKHGRWLDTVLMQRVLGPGTSTPPTIPVP